MNFKKLFLKKNILFIFYFTVVVILIFFIWKNFSITDNLKNNQEVKETIDLGIKSEERKNIDTDNDGLQDWQEILYGSNPELPDTDGDGISDGEEVTRGSDPIVFGEGKKQNDVVEKIIKDIQLQDEVFSGLVKEYEEENGIKDSLGKIKEKNPSQNKQLEVILERKKNIKNKMNLAGTVIKKFYYKLDNSNHIFNNIFMFFYPDNNKNIQQLNIDENVKKSVLKYQKLTPKQLENFNKLAQSYIETSKELKKINKNGQQIEKYISDLATQYNSLGLTMTKMHDLVKKGDRKQNIEDLSKKYSNAVRLQAGSRKFIAEYLELLKIEFADGEPGEMFVYSL